jgi:hypothetical protein
MQRIDAVILITGILIAFTTPVKAQISFNVGINISSQPIWGPVGYSSVQYYYLPDIDVYYYVPQALFLFQAGGRWLTSSSLPPDCSNYDLYNGYKVVINETRPYMHDRDYREKYSSYKNRHDQQPIRDSHDSKYFVIKDHPEHNNQVKQQKHSDANGNKQAQGAKAGQGSKTSQVGKTNRSNKPGKNSKTNQNNKSSQTIKQEENK